MLSKRKILAIGISAAAVATIGVTSTIVANAGAVSGPYRMTVNPGDDYRALAAGDCGPRMEYLADVYIESTAEDGESVMVYTCQAP